MKKQSLFGNAARNWTYCVDEVESPSVWVESSKGDGVGVGVECQSDLHAEVHDHETLGSQHVWQDLDSVADQQTRPSKGVEDAKDPDEHNHSIRSTGGAMVFIEPRSQGPDGECDQHAGSGREESGATAQFVNEHGHGDGYDKSETGLPSRQTQLLGGAGNTSGLVEEGGVVGDDSVARPL